MPRLRAAKPVKLIVGLLGADPDLLRRARQLLVHQYGPVDLESQRWPFTWTDYYEAEMGPHLQRCFLAFERLIRPEALAEIKRYTRELEQQIADDCGPSAQPRPVNIDPGYLDPARLVLATTKDRNHRLYLGLGIYAEVTLHYTAGTWQPWPWTYPDYRDPTYHPFFDQVRQRLCDQQKQWSALTGPGDGPSP